MKKNHLNLLFLENGFGKYIDDLDTTFKQFFLTAEENAKKQKVGLWDSTSTLKTISIKYFILNYSNVRNLYNEIISEFLFSFINKKGNIDVKYDFGIFWRSEDRWNE